jgi:hypothetical protein
MTIDQLLYVAARIDDPEKPVMETVGRALEIVLHCEKAAEADAKFNDMASRGLSLPEMLRELHEKAEAAV